MNQYLSGTKTERNQMIESYSFGSMTITGQSHRNDLKIIDDNIDDILYASVETLVVGTGAYGGMKVTEEAAQAIEGQGINLVAVPTKEAVSIFNSLHAQGKKVAGAFHLTC
jgi:hypothetical protein